MYRLLNRERAIVIAITAIFGIWLAGKQEFIPQPLVWASAIAYIAFQFRIRR